MKLIAFGANLNGPKGTPEQAILKAAEELGRCGVTIKALSYIWLTEPVPKSDQPWYHNAVARVETTLGPNNLLSLLQDIELSFGRKRTVINAPRILDLDLLAYDAELLEGSPTLELPHPRLHERAFVLYPLNEVAPEWIHPETGANMAQMIGSLSGDQKIERLEKVAA